MGIYIFDFDGTLGNSMPSFVEAWMDLLKEYNIENASEIIKIITPLGYIGAAKYFIETFKMPYEVDELVSIVQENIYPFYRDKIVLKPGVSECLKKLKEEGNSLNVLTASPYRMVAPVLKRCGVYELFDHVWSCEDFNTTKGDPNIYREAIKRVGGKIEDAVFFDDNLEALKTAVSAGIYCVGVYDDASIDYVEEIKAIVNRYIYSFNELEVTNYVY